jgi:D-alanyl-D-alanine endopeptidase (penicillin-binding protein 7)
MTRILLALCAVLGAGAVWTLTRAPDAVPFPPIAPWAPPDWHPAREALAVLEDLDGTAPDGRRGIRSRAGILADLDAGVVLWARDADTPRPVASITKLISALALASFGGDLDRTICVDAELWTARPGARSRFETGACHSGWDFVGAALVASDNRGAWAMPRLADRTLDEFVDRMVELSADLRLRDATWVDPTGIEDEDAASPRDVLKAATAVALHPALASIASAPVWSLDARALTSTNRLAGEFDFLAAKTGYTDASGYCFTAIADVDGRRLGLALLGAPTDAARFADARALLGGATAVADAADLGRRHAPR